MIVLSGESRFRRDISGESWNRYTRQSDGYLVLDMFITTPQTECRVKCMQVIMRILKQLLYGSLYVAIFVVIVGGIYFVYLRPIETCSDNIQNQDEIGVDCGGSCISCELENERLMSSDVKVLPSGEGQVTLVAGVESENTAFIAKIDYSFEIFGKFGGMVSSITGKSSVIEGSPRYIIAPGIQSSEKDISRATFKITNYEWQSPDEQDIYIIDIKDRKTTTHKDTIEINGVVSNESSFSIPTLRISALVFDKDNNLIGASATEVSNLQIGGSKKFRVFFPAGENLSDRADTTKTQTFWEVL